MNGSRRSSSGTADDITAFDPEPRKQKGCWYQGQVSSRVSTETRAVIDGYQRMVTNLVTGKTDSQTDRGCALWCDLAGLKTQRR